MINVKFEDLRPGMIVGKPVITSGGQVIIKEQTELTNQLIARIEFYSIFNIAIDDSIPTDSTKAPALAPVSIRMPLKEAPSKIEDKERSPVHNQSHSQKIQQSPKFQEFQIEYSKKIGSTKNALDHLLASEEIDPSTLLDDTIDLIQGSSLNTMDLFDMLHNMRQVDDTIYAHSLNVGLLARVLGKWLKFSNQDIDTLTLAGLLHDIGKLRIPDAIMNKPGRLTPEEFAIIKMHPRIGYDTISTSSLDLRIKQSILMHHERCDGSGYPFGFMQQDISKFAMIISIVDVYDAMTAARSYRGPLCPFSVIQQFEEEGLQKYYPQYILTFLEHIAATYQNNRVLLSNAKHATIIMLNQHRLSKPIVQLEDGNFLDLSKQFDLYISAII